MVQNAFVLGPSVHQTFDSIVAVRVSSSCYPIGVAVSCARLVTRPKPAFGCTVEIGIEEIARDYQICSPGFCPTVFILQGDQELGPCITIVTIFPKKKASVQTRLIDSSGSDSHD